MTGGDTSTSGDILFELAGGLALVTLNRPAALNALTTDMIHRFDAQLVAWETDPAVHRIVVRGGWTARQLHPPPGL